MDTTVADTLVGRVLDGRYRIQERIARGGMATVYRALDMRLDRHVAVKVMHSTLAEDPEFVSRFTREAKAAARLSHPNVVAVFDQGSDGGVVFLVMEYVDGATLRDLIRERGRLSPRQALDVVAPILSALDAAHRAGIVHRDIKPENVLISADGRIKVADFGLARAIAASHHTTTTGLLIGTAAYLAPEQIVKGIADPRTDLYAAGIVLYELLIGRPPYEGATAMAVVFKHVNEQVPPPSEAREDVPRQIDALVLDATQRDPDDRPPTAAELLEQLQAASRTLPPEPLDLTAPTQVIGEHVTTVIRSDPPAGRGRTLVAPPDWPTVRPPVKAPPGRPRKRVSWVRGWRLAVLLLVIVTLVAAGVGAYLGLHDNSSSNGAPGSASSAAATSAAASAPAPVATTTMQNFVKATRAEALTLGRQFNLNVVFAPTPVNDPTIPLDSVVSQDPPYLSDQSVNAGQTVTLTLSAGPQTYPVPAAALVGQTLDQATATLSQAHLTLGTHSSRYDTTAPKNTVLSVTTDASTPLPAGSPVNVVLSRGPAPVAVPDETSKTRTAAKADLAAKLFTNVTTSLAFSDTVPSGNVISQTPAAPAQAQVTATVSLVISKGPQLFEIPPLKGLSAATAEAKLELLGMKYHTQSLPNGPGLVVYTTPAAGTMQPRGTIVTLEIF